MSIYCTWGTFKIEEPETSGFDPKFVDILVQMVPPHIGCKCCGCDVDSYAAFLPPPVDCRGDVQRAAVFIGPDERKGTSRNGQEYCMPLLTLSGSEFKTIPFVDLVSRLQDRLAELAEYPDQ